MKSLFRLFLLSALFSFSVLQYSFGSNDTVPATSQDFYWGKYSVTAGGFLTSLSSSLIIGSDDLGVGLSLDVEDALGLKRTEFVFRTDLEYTFGKKNKSAFVLGYFGFHRRSTKILESELELGDNVYPIGTTIYSRFDYQIIRGIYKYSYFSDPRVQLGASFGFFVMPINFEASSSGSSTTATDFTAPLPVLGVNANFAVTPKLLIKQSFEFLYLQFDQFRGGVTDINFRVEYYPWKHIGLGIGYNSFQMKLRIPDSKDYLIDFAGNIQSGYTGLLAFATLKF